MKLRIRIDGKTGKEFTTKVGIAQGDCLSALLFIFYLANTIKEAEDDHTYAKKVNFLLSPKYADDITWITNNRNNLESIKTEVTQSLNNRNLKVNAAKTEQYSISRANQGNDWKKCKILGSLLDTEEDIKRRKILALGAIKNFKHVFQSSKIRQSVKIRVFNTYIRSIFLYNAEVWTLTKGLNECIDAFQRRLIRIVLNVVWPKTLSNRDLYRRTKVTKWSKIIRRKRLSWLGHLLRLDRNTPAVIAFAEALKPQKKPSGRQKQTWFRQMKEDLDYINFTFNFRSIELSLRSLSSLAGNRQNWRELVECAIPR